jgi:hypothetical protein
LDFILKIVGSRGKSIIQEQNYHTYIHSGNCEKNGLKGVVRVESRLKVRPSPPRLGDMVIVEKVFEPSQGDFSHPSRLQPALL